MIVGHLVIVEYPPGKVRIEFGTRTVIAATRSEQEWERTIALAMKDLMEKAMASNPVADGQTIVERHGPKFLNETILPEDGETKK